MTRFDFSALWHLFVLGWRAQWAGRAMLSGAMVVLGLLIVMWGFLWMRVDPGTLARYGLDSATMIWYFAAAEVVIFAGGYLHRGIIADVREGRVAAALTRPAPYPALELAQAAGECALRFAVFAGGAAVFSLVVTGGAMPSLSALALLFLPVSMALACAIWMLAMMAVGLSTLWVSASEPIFWIVQKLMFLFGGLVIPVSAMPGAIKAVGWASPFPAMLYAPASFLIDGSAAHIGAMLVVQIFWLGIAVCGVAALWRAATCKIMSEG